MFWVDEVQLREYLGYELERLSKSDRRLDRSVFASGMSPKQKIKRESGLTGDCQVSGIASYSAFSPKRMSEG